MKGSALQILRAGALLAAFAAVGAGLLAGTYWLTREPIDASARARLLRELNAVLPASEYDNALTTDTVLVSDDRIGGTQTVYRARRDGKPVALILTVTAADGYSGPIELLAGVRVDGSLSGVRVTRHRETPGLGDKIDLRKSDWVLDFTGRTLDNPDDTGWAVRKDGGIFDQFAGATITPRAVVEAVQRTLQFVADQGDALFGAAAVDETPAPPPAETLLEAPQ
ncbi:electron transport complex subunit RsxG [Flagellatimonas centrodinii]|uniref:electron transport complex subunit RsxG n=1 Tax=Flagellatimonas centrodinii TaxID=2806210 RepID=UPI001FEFA94C|nr:electron transport complex subunit RsxG [Flagellatimonas centrodinii]ULQ46993.1 electron transport complex subunit RsxG [Flagellatimonas centrodinii]